jgi:putative ABC transport system permease protein
MFVAFAAAIMCLFIVLEGVGKAQRGDVFSDDDRILIVSNGVAPSYPLPVRYVDQIKESNIVGVEHVAALNFVPATMGGKRKRIAAMAADPIDLLAANTDLVVLGGMAKRWIEDRNSVLVGRDFAEREGLKIGDSISINSTSFRIANGEGTLKLRIVGLYSVRGDAYPAIGVLMHDKLIRPNGQFTVSQGASGILVLLKDRQNAAEASRKIDALFAKTPIATRTTLREQFVETFNDQGAGVATLMRLYGIAGLVAGVMLLVTFCYFNAHRLEKSCARFEEIGFARIEIVIRASLSMAFVIIVGAISGIALTMAVTALFDLAIKENFPYFDTTAVSGLSLLPPVAGLAFAVAFVAFFVVNHRQKNLYTPERA